VTTEKTYTSTSNNSISGSLKRLEDTTARFTNANFQEVSAHTSSGKDVSETRGSEGKGKKSSAHSSGQRGRKPGGGRNPGTTVSAASPFPQAGYKRAQTSGIEEETVKEKKRKGNKQSKHGPGRPKGNKNQENVSHLSVSSASPTSSVASAAGSITSSSLQKSPTLLRNGSLQSLSVGSSPVGSEISMQYRHDGACPTTTFSELLNAIHNDRDDSSTLTKQELKFIGIYNSNDVAVSFPNVVSGSGSSTPVSSSHLPQQSSGHLQQVGALSPSAVSSAAPAVATTQANTLSGSSLSQAPSHMYGNRLNPNSSMAALIAQSENNQTDQDLGDNSRNLVGRGSSPRGSLSPRSPVSSLQIRYDQPG
ncbi:MLLT10 isoform 7, partial [Pan troglodytes]